MALTDVKSEQIQSSVALAGSPTTTTQSASDNSTKIATTAYVETAVANLVASAPSALNTLDELAAALNDDASFSTTVTNSIATKLPLAGGTLTGALVGTTATFAGGAANNNDDANILTLNASQHARLLVDTSSTSGHRATLALESNGNELTLGTTGSISYLGSVGNLEIDGGNVIINKSNFSSLPTGSKLNIFGDGVTLRLDGSSATTKSILFRNVNAGNPGEVYADGSLRFRTEDASTRITFHTNSSGSNNERMRITAGGDVSIGSDHSGFSGWRVLNIRGESTGGLVNFENSSGTRSATFANQGSGIRYQTHISGGYHRFETDGTPNGYPLFIKDNGYIGMGNGAPTAQLTITDENAGQASIQARNFAVSATGSFVNQHAFEFRAATSTTTHGMLVALNENDITRRSLEVADSTGIFATFVQGKLGIGRNNPSARLHLQSTGSATYSGTSAGTNIGLYLTNAESGAAGRTIGIGMTCESNTEIYLNAVTGANNNGGDFVIASRNAGTRAEKMRVHAAGSVTKPLNPSFQVRLAQSSGVNGGNGPVVLNYSGSTFHNVGSHFNTSNGRFTAPVTGVYVFHANVRVDGFTGNYSYLTLQHFSSTGTQQASKGRDLQHGNSATYINHNISQNVYLLANEYVRIVYENNGDSSVNLDSDSYFSGYLLG